MTDEEAFLATLKANPADDTARLVYADWLDERDEPAKAAYLRAVVELTQLRGGTPEYTAAAECLYSACARTEWPWRKAAGARFDVAIDRLEPAYKIHAIKVIRERTGFGLAEAKALAESVPTPLFSWLPFEQALPHLLALDARDHLGNPVTIGAAIRPTAWPDAGSGAVFDILLCSSDFAHWSGYAVSGLAQLLDTSAEVVRVRLTELPLVVASRVPPGSVADIVRRIKLICNVGRAMPPGAIRVVPQLPTE